MGNACNDAMVIKRDLELCRQKLNSMMDVKKAIVDEELVEQSQCLDKLINEYTLKRIECIERGDKVGAR